MLNALHVFSLSNCQQQIILNKLWRLSGSKKFWPFKRFHIFRKILSLATISLHFRISFARENCEFFGFNLFRKKGRNVREIEIAKISLKFAKILWKNNAKISRKTNVKISRKKMRKFLEKIMQQMNIWIVDGQTET